MRLSIIFELLLIFLLIAFAAYGRVIDSSNHGIKKLSTSNLPAPISLKQATESVNKYCVCNENICNCCRDFHIPLVQLSGPGCASLQYLQENKLAMQLSIGDNILSSNIVNGNNPKPVCVNLPGGFSKFCGKIYSIKKEADKHFKACLGLELRSASELEASLRVSCFRFGPDGLKLRPAEPLPPTFSVPSANTDDDYDDIFSLDDDDDDEDDADDDDEETENDDSEKIQTSSSSLATEQQNQDQEIEQDDEDDDLLGLSALLDIFTGDDDSTTNKKTKPTSSTPLPISFTIPILALTTTSNPVTHSSGLSVATDSSVIDEVSTTGVTTIRPHTTPTTISNHDSQEISTEKTFETISNVDSTTLHEISHQNNTRTTSIGITEIPNTVTLDTGTVENISNGIRSKINSAKIKELDKKQVASSKIKKQGTKQPIVDDSIEVDNDSFESVYDDENDEDDQSSDENNNNIKQITEATSENDKTINAEHAATSDIDDDESYDESDEDEDEDEDADIEVMSTLLEDEISKEKFTHRKDKVKTNKVNKKTESVPTRSNYDYELSDMLGRKYSNRANKKGTKRKISYKNDFKNV